METSKRYEAHLLDKLRWPFGGKNPLIKCGQSTEDVDPFPGYAHPLTLVEEGLEHVTKVFPVGGDPVQCFVLQYEVIARTNGHASKWYGRKDGEFKPYIVLSGKRIPPMPSMTRYLTAHEYGHVVDMWICQQMGCEEDFPLTKFDREYAEVRGIEPEGAYGGGEWHKNIGEIIANDFRVLMCNVEVDFWPHPCTHPLLLKSSGLQDYWRELLDKYGSKTESE